MTDEQLAKFERLGGGCTCRTTLSMCWGACLGHLSGVALKYIKELEQKVEVLSKGQDSYSPSEMN